MTGLIKSPLTPLFQRGEVPPFEKGRLGGISDGGITPSAYETLVSLSSQENMKNKEDVLIIEDDEMLGDILRSALESDGVKASWCRSGVHAFELLRNNDYDVIVSDYRMPVMNGAEVMKMLRLSFPETLLIGISIEPRREREFLEAGADAFLLKPFEFEELLSMVRQRCLTR